MVFKKLERPEGRIDEFTQTFTVYRNKLEKNRSDQSIKEEIQDWILSQKQWKNTLPKIKKFYGRQYYYCRLSEDENLLFVVFQSQETKMST